MKFLLLLLIAFGCSTAPEKSISAKAIRALKPVQRDNVIDVYKYTNFSEKQALKTEQALDKITETYNSQCFEDFMVEREKGVTVKGKIYKLHSTNDKTALEVVKHLKTSKTSINLIWYYSRTSTKGYTKKGVDWIKLNSKFYGKMSQCEIAKGLGHEGTHKLGYGHTKKRNKQRPYGVPYSVGEGIKTCCK